MQEMISVDNSKAAVGLLGKLLQLSYIEQCILLDHIEDGMTIEDLVASLKSSASHEAKSIAKRIEALSEELNGSGEQDMANVAEEMGIKMPDIDRKSMVDADMGGERGFADMQDVLRLADLIDRPARQGSEKGDER